jgi:hypothetical protein
MAGRTTFTRSEADRIRSLLDKARRSDRQAQKTLRATLRRIGFRIREFDASGAGFTRSDFDELVRRGVITIVDDGAPTSASDLQSSVNAATQATPAPEHRRDTNATGADVPQITHALSVERARHPGAPLPPVPGLYAFHGDASTWRTLGLGDPPDDRPLYVGKAQDSIAKRVERTHLQTGHTGHSTLRRSLAALLVDVLDLRACPRSPSGSSPPSNYALHQDCDTRLTDWMREHLVVACCPISPADQVGVVEESVLREMLPPLNLSGITTPWKSSVAAARAQMAKQAAAG